MDNEYDSVAALSCLFGFIFLLLFCVIASAVSALAVSISPILSFHYPYFTSISPFADESLHNSCLSLSTKAFRRISRVLGEIFHLVPARISPDPSIEKVSDVFVSILRCAARRKRQSRTCGVQTHSTTFQMALM